MATYSTNLKLTLIATGDESGTWGTTTNTNLGTLLEQAISGYTTQAITDGADTTITIPNGATGVARNMVIECTGALTAARNLVVPASTKLYFIYNNTSGGYAVTVKVSGQTGVSVPNGAKVLLMSNGTDIVSATSYVASLTLGSALAATSGGTGLASYTTGDILYASSASALSKLAGVAVGNALISGGVGTAPAWGKISLTGAVSGTLPVANGGTGVTSSTGSGSVVLSTSPTFTTPNLGTPSAGVLTNATGLPLTTGVTGTLPVANGGTGTASLTANNVLLGNGTSAVQVVAPGTAGNVLTSTGTTWASTAPASAVTSVNSQTGAVVTTGVDSIGCTMWLMCSNTADLGAVGVTVSGSNLRYGYSTNNSRTQTEYAANASNTYSAGGTSLASGGTWRKMSSGPTWVDDSGGSGDYYWYPQLFVRIS